jgi:hypothetical protein
MAPTPLHQETKSRLASWKLAVHSLAELRGAGIHYEHVLIYIAVYIHILVLVTINPFYSPLHPSLTSTSFVT